MLSMGYREKYSPELEASFESWIERRGIEVVLFDFDGTLIDTDSLFGEKIQNFFDFCQGCIPGIEVEELKVEFKRMDMESFNLLGVSERKWDYVINELCQIYCDEGFREGLHHFEQIYLSAPLLHEGAVETLEMFKRKSRRLGLITHASRPWTEIKLDGVGIREYFDRIKVIDVEEHKFKEMKHWREEIEEFGIDPSKVMAVGDNLRGDIEAAHMAGVGTLAWIPSKWHVYTQGEVPPGTFVAPSIKELIPSLLMR